MRFPRLPRITPPAAALTLFLTGAAACSPDGAPTAPTLASARGAPREKVLKEFTAISRNVYLGGDIGRVLALPSATQLPFAVNDLWGRIVASDFPARAEKLADEIVAKGADLVGLQEVELYRSQTPSDALLGGTTPATHVEYDFLALLTDALARRGWPMQVAAVSTNADVEAPRFDPSNVGGACEAVPASFAIPACYDDLRLTDHDVILAREGVSVSDPRAANYHVNFSAQVGGPGGPMITSTRGWASTLVDLGRGNVFRFVDTHLEVDGIAPVQVAQASELLAILAAEPHPVVLVGDFNSSADGSDTPTYGLIRAAGFADVVNVLKGEGYDGALTCCFDEAVLDPGAALSKRIDIVFYRGAAFKPFLVDVVGDDAALDRTPSGLWPSDHAGTAAAMKWKP
ncbi:MAG TPA: endonuclease/exonuclease/phosphatase family protein [Gemmatimonadaceae bacterium]|nr:endonuclease/exonuclease/phosphatase family protein [Gemmatimonadaceae bacterium]